MDFSHLINIIKDKNPPLVFLPGYSKDGGFIMRQAKNSGVKVQFLGGDGWGLQLFDFGGDSVEGAIGADHWHIEMKYPLTAELINIHEKKYGTSVIKSTGTPLAFDAILLMVDAINRAKSTDGKQIRDAIAATKNFPGSSGIYSFDENGDALNKGVAIVSFENGGKKLIKVINQ